MTLLIVPALDFTVMYLLTAKSNTLLVMYLAAPNDNTGKSSFCVPVPASIEESSMISKSVRGSLPPSIIKITLEV